MKLKRSEAVCMCRHRYTEHDDGGRCSHFGDGQRDCQCQTFTDPKRIHITIPACPPSVNHYILHTRSGRHYKSAEAESFAALVALEAREHRGLKFEASRISITVTLGHKMKGDIDNFPKVVLDSLVRAGVIRSDASIVHLEVFKGRDTKPSTEVWIYG